MGFFVQEVLDSVSQQDMSRLHKQMRGRKGLVFTKQYHIYQPQRPTIFKLFEESWTIKNKQMSPDYASVTLIVWLILTLWCSTELCRTSELGWNKRKVRWQKYSLVVTLRHSLISLKFRSEINNFHKDNKLEDIMEDQNPT